MRWPIVLFGFALLSNALFAEETLREISWSELATRKELTAGEVLPADGDTPFERLRITNPDAQPVSVNILTIEDPGVTTKRYAILGRVRTEGLKGKGYLEMWSYFPEGGAYFSRTLGESGPMGYLSGTSPWRDFMLPFYIGKEPARPRKLDMNIFFAGTGAVELGPLRLVQYEAGMIPALPGQWWDPHTGGRIGGVFGAVLGCLGALAGGLASRGRARRFVFAAHWGMVGLGAVMLVGGIIAVARSQPFAVFFPLLLAGFLCVVIPLTALSKVRRRYEEIELRRIDSHDAA